MQCALPSTLCLRHLVRQTSDIPYLYLVSELLCNLLVQPRSTLRLTCSASVSEVIGAALQLLPVVFPIEKSNWLHNVLSQQYFIYHHSFHAKFVHSQLSHPFQLSQATTTLCTVLLPVRDITSALLRICMLWKVNMIFCTSAQSYSELSFEPELLFSSTYLFAFPS